MVLDMMQGDFNGIINVQAGIPSRVTQNNLAYSTCAKKLGFGWKLCIKDTGESALPFLNDLKIITSSVDVFNANSCNHAKLFEKLRYTYIHTPNGKLIFTSPNLVQSFRALHNAVDIFEEEFQESILFWQKFDGFTKEDKFSFCRKILEISNADFLFSCNFETPSAQYGFNFQQQNFRAKRLGQIIIATIGLILRAIDFTVKCVLNMRNFDRAEGAGNTQMQLI
ncbi:MAG: hypothetical protein ACI9A8_001615 [Cryomorphaceae bacterium]|jgi:hypothetical protein